MYTSKGRTIKKKRGKSPTLKYLEVLLKRKAYEIACDTSKAEDRSRLQLLMIKGYSDQMTKDVICMRQPIV